MRLRNQADGQLGLGADGVQARRIQNNQALLEQRMGNIDQGMTPLGHLNQAISADQRVVIRVIIVPKAEGPGLVTRDMDDLGDLLKRLGQLRRIVHVQVNTRPFLGDVSPFHQGLGL